MKEEGPKEQILPYWQHCNWFFAAMSARKLIPHVKEAERGFLCLSQQNFSHLCRQDLYRVFVDVLHDRK